MENAKYSVYALEGKENCEIFRSKDLSSFDLIKDRITIFEFIDENSYVEFLKTIDDELDIDHVILTTDELEYIMDNPPSNQVFIKNNNNVNPTW